MSEPEGVLQRWSRRKRRAAASRSGRPPPENDAGADATAPEEVVPPVDPASLPAIETLDARSDIRAFLAAGVPAELTRAALRRAWSADPAIRDFIGLSENSWDFNAPDGAAGFGSLSAEDVRRLLERLIEEPQAAEAKPASGGDRPELDRDRSVDAGDPTSADALAAEPRQEVADQVCRPPPPHRRHGGALPK